MSSEQDRVAFFDALNTAKQGRIGQLRWEGCLVTARIVGQRIRVVIHSTGVEESVALGVEVQMQALLQEAQSQYARRCNHLTLLPSKKDGFISVSIVRSRQ